LKNETPFQVSRHYPFLKNAQHYFILFYFIFPVIFLVILALYYLFIYFSNVIPTHYREILKKKK
jgi:hypothetical protein